MEQIHAMKATARLQQIHYRRPHLALCAGILSAGLTACGGNDDAVSDATASLSAEQCTSIAGSFSMPNVRLTSAQFVPASTATATAAAIPGHCEILGAADERTGTDGQPYAIRFRLRVPVEQPWNRRFLFTGGGGSNGSVGSALTATGALTSPLARGYAVVAQDSGHDNTINNIPTRSGNRAFNFDFEARKNYGYRSYERVTVISKELIKALYGDYPRRSYFAGCSEGGREALMVTQRYPDYFDGVIAGAPGAGPVGSLLRNAWVVRSYAELAAKQGLLDRNGLPFINRALTDADLAVLQNGITASCDALDGVVDGMSQDVRACNRTFNVAALTCSPGTTTNCLSSDKVAAIQKQMGGMPNDLAWAYDLGMTSGTFRSWWLGQANAAQSSASFVTSAYTTQYLTTPPVVDLTIKNGSETYRTLLEFDPVRDAGGIYLATPEFPESVYQMSYAGDPDLTRFRSRGGKMIMFHGVSDGAFTVNHSTDYYDKVDRASGGTARNFASLYVVPGMGHCGGGPATSEFELLQALETWVEQGTAPGSILARAPANTPWPGRTRPLCPYPSVARYTGAGDVESADNFRCVSP
jgi:hypothetical protein